MFDYLPHTCALWRALAGTGAWHHGEAERTLGLLLQSSEGNRSASYGHFKTAKFVQIDEPPKPWKSSSQPEQEHTESEPMTKSKLMSMGAAMGMA